MAATAAARMGQGETAELVPAGSRFALGAPRPAGVGGVVAASAPVGVRPFGLRLFRHACYLGDMGLPAYRYCPVRQVAVADDGSGEPLVRRLVGWDKTTTGSQDGEEAPQEEWTMDYLR
ncbi:MAG TPA: putative ATP-grasp-modified RiPP [Mycobacteriales bacterium]|nr:putative ATP-grasp-modified RiPP [Mycobacteriales bacterium]